MSVKFVEPNFDRLVHISENMREADRIEVWASHKMTPIEAVINSVELSDMVSVAVYKTKPCAVFGLVKRDLLTGTGCPWLLGTDDIDLCKRDFILHKREGVKEMLTHCRRLENYVHVANTKSIRWLKTMGFKFGKPERLGFNGEYFVKFSLEN